MALTQSANGRIVLPTRRRQSVASQASQTSWQKPNGFTFGGPRTDDRDRAIRRPSTPLERRVRATHVRIGRSGPLEVDPITPGPRRLFRPDVKLDASQVHDLRQSAPMPTYQNPGGYRTPPAGSMVPWNRGGTPDSGQYRPPYPQLTAPFDLLRFLEDRARI
jgi:hypothetical protein